MSTIFVKGNLFTYEGLQSLAHGCNCAGAMGRGIAVEFRSRFPNMYGEYKKLCLDGKFNPGDVFPWTENDITIFNLGTQKHWKLKAEIWAIEKSLKEAIKIAKEKGIKNIGLPRIGAGLGGLSWEKVKEVFKIIGEETEIELVVFEEFEK